MSERLTVRQAVAELGIDGADLYPMVSAGAVDGRPDFVAADVLITRGEVERVRTALAAR